MVGMKTATIDATNYGLKVLVSEPARKPNTYPRSPIQRDTSRTEFGCAQPKSYFGLGSPRRLISNKKGYFYFMEIALVVFLVTSFFFILSPHSEISYQKFQDSSNLKRTGFGILKSLDSEGIFSAYVNDTMSNSNFTALRIYINAALPNTANSQIEYAVNSTSCYSENGALGSCGLNLNVNTTKQFEVTRADYTYSKISNPITIRLYLWRIL